jgi:hypothetical protein
MVMDVLISLSVALPAGLVMLAVLHGATLAIGQLTDAFESRRPKVPTPPPRGFDIIVLPAGRFSSENLPPHEHRDRRLWFDR